MANIINLHVAIDLIKSGGHLDQVVIADLETSRVGVADALLLAENGFIVPDGNIVYDDAQVQYDPDFDDVAWGQPVPFRQIKQALESNGNAEYTIKLQVKNADMLPWLVSHGAQINLVVSGLLNSMYEAERMKEG